MERLQWYFRARLHRRIFVSFGLTILLAIGLGGAAMRLVGGEPSWHRDADRGAAFVADRFAAVWDDPAARHALVDQASRDLDLDFELRDARGERLEASGTACRHPYTAPVVRAGATLGEVRICADRRPSAGPRVLAALAMAFFVLWAASGKLARRLSRPFGEIARVAEELGRGNLAARVDIGRGRHGEARILAAALNDMAERIERQLADQRALLATVSHELRTPLARIRLLSEMARGDAPGDALAQIDREVLEIDALVADLLASSRLDFGALARSTLDAGEIATRALEIADVPPDTLVVEAPHVAFEGDPTLMARAIANLLENAKRHAGGVSTLRVTATAAHVAFEVEDDGEGLAPGEEEKIFEPFYRRPRQGTSEAQSLGLGLALVRRIAEAHGGRAYARTRTEGGALVGLELPRP